MLAQFPPPATGASYVDASDALTYISWLRKAIPGTNWYFTVTDQILKCGLREGVVGARAYLRNDLSAATIMLVISERQLSSWQDVVYACTIGRLANALGGGPTPGFDPCASVYQYDDTVSTVRSRYFVFLVSTSQADCAGIPAFHASQRGTVTPIWSSS